MVHYQYFISPKTTLTNQVISQLSSISLDNPIAELCSLDLADLKKIFELKFELQGTGGRASVQPINFSVHRRLGNDGNMKELTPAQIEILLRRVLKLKPGYLQTAKRFLPKN